MLLGKKQSLSLIKSGCYSQKSGNIGNLHSTCVAAWLRRITAMYLNVFVSIKILLMLPIPKPKTSFSCYITVYEQKVLIYCASFYAVLKIQSGILTFSRTYD